MIIGIGNDLVDIRRIQKVLERHGARFAGRCFTLSEQQQAASRKDQAAFYAKRFAVKEAMLKALGTGFADGISWQDIAISNDQKGKPGVDLSGKAADRLNDIVPHGCAYHVHVSISDEMPYAQAFVIIEAR